MLATPIIAIWSVILRSCLSVGDEMMPNKHFKLYRRARFRLYQYNQNTESIYKNCISAHVIPSSFALCICCVSIPL